MTETNSETIQPFYWYRYRNNPLDRYLLQRELDFIRRFVDGATQAGRLLYRVSPSILVSARKKNKHGFPTSGDQ